MRTNLVLEGQVICDLGECIYLWQQVKRPLTFFIFCKSSTKNKEKNEGTFDKCDKKSIEIKRYDKQTWNRNEIHRQKEKKRKKTESSWNECCIKSALIIMKIKHYKSRLHVLFGYKIWEKALE